MLVESDDLARKKKKKKDKRNIEIFRLFGDERKLTDLFFLDRLHLVSICTDDARISFLSLISKNLTRFEYFITFALSLSDRF